jgi:hypothetical protein
VEKAGFISEGTSKMICGSEAAFVAGTQYASKLKGAWEGVRSMLYTENMPEQKVAEGSVVSNRVWGQMLDSTDASQSSLGPLYKTVQGKYGDPDSDHAIIALLRKWSLVYTADIAAATTAAQLIDDVEPYDGSFPTRLAWYNQFFRFWRGSIEYMFYFCTSPFYTSRWYIVVVYEAGVTPTASSVGQGNMLWYEVNVRGSTWVNVAVPYLHTTPWNFCRTALDVHTGYQAPSLYIIQMDAPRANGDQTPHTTIVAWIRAGEDFMFSAPRQASITRAVIAEEEPLRGSLQSFVNAMGEDPVVIGGGVILPAFEGKCDYSTIGALLRRYSYRNTADFYPWPLGLGVTASENSLLGNFDLLCSNFIFHTGSVRFKGNQFQPTSGSTYAATYMLGTGDLSAVATAGVPIGRNSDDGLLIMDTTSNGVFVFECPFFSNVEAMANSNFLAPTQYPIEHQAPGFLGAGTATELNNLFISAGSTFKLFYDVPPILDRDYWPDYATITPPFETQREGFDNSSSLSTDTVASA